MSNDFAGVGIQGHMQLAPLAAGFGTMNWLNCIDH
jgi:hypothetical protein